MKKITLTLAAFIAAVTLNAQTTLFSDDFNDEDISDWTLYDEDGDGFEWSVVQIQDQDGNPVNTPVLRSASWNQTAGPLTPNNYAVSPAIDLSGVDAQDAVMLHWDVSAADASYADENYTVYVATANDVSTLSGSSVNYNELVTDNGAGGSDNIYQKSLDISSFIGETVYVAFRHHDVSDQFTIEIDNVEVISDATASLQETDFNGFSFYNNNSVLTLKANESITEVKLHNILGQQVFTSKVDETETQLNISNLSAGIYLAQVQINGQTKTFKFVKN